MEMVSAIGLDGAIAHLRCTRGNAESESWLSFLERSRFALDRAGSRGELVASLQQMGWDDEDPVVAASCRSSGVPPPVLHAVTRTRRGSGDVITLSGHGSRVRVVAELRPGVLVSASDDGTVRTWSRTDGQEITCCDVGEVRALVPVGGGDRVAVAVRGRGIELWNMADACLVHRFDCPEDSRSWVIVQRELSVSAGFFDGSVHSWAVNSPALRFQHQIHAGPVRAMVTTSSGGLLSGAYDGTVVLATQGSECRRLSSHQHPVRAVVAGGGCLASADDGGTTIIRSADGDDLLMIAGPRRGVHQLCLLDDERLLAIADFDGTVRIVDLVTGEQIGECAGHLARVRAMFESGDGRLVTASDDRTVRHWSLPRGDEADRMTGHVGWVRAAVELSDGSIASASADGTIRIARRTASTGPPPGHRGWIRAMVDVGGGVLASGAEDGAVRLWDVSTSEGTVVVDQDVSTVRALASSGEWLVSGSDNGSLASWRLRSGCPPEATARMMTDDPIRALAVAGVDTVTTAGAQGSVVARLVDTLEAVGSLDLSAHGGCRRACALSRGRVAIGAEDGSIAVWCPAADDLHWLSGHTGRIWALCASEERLVSVSFDRTVRVWDVNCGETIASCGAPLGLSWAVADVTAGLVAFVSPVGIVRLVDLVDLSVVGRVDLRHATCCAETASFGGGQLRIAVAGDSPSPTFLEVNLDSIRA